MKQHVVIYDRPSTESVRALLEACRLPVDDLPGLDPAHFLACGPRAAPHGVVGLEPLGGGLALLRSLAVAEAERGRGLGAALLSAAERHAARLGVGTLYLLTDTADAFFVRHGWRCVARGAAPEEVRATRQFSSLCPDSARLMCRRPGGPAPDPAPAPG